MSASPNQHSAATGAPHSTPATAAGAAAARSKRWRWPAILGGLGAIAAIIWLTTAARTSDLRAVLQGRQFSPVERRRAVEVLSSAGIEHVRFARQQLLVSAESLASADAALARAAERSSSQPGQAAPVGSLFEQFSTVRRQEQATAAARAAQVSRLLEQLPGVETVELVWDEEPRVGRRQAPRVRATVFLKPEPGTTIGLETVHAVRTAVAGSRAHLSAADVAVMDIASKITYEAIADPTAYAAESRVAQEIAECRRRLEAALADIPDVGIKVLPMAPPIVDSVSRAAASPDSSSSSIGRPIAGPSGPNQRMELAANPFVPTSPANETTGVSLAICVVVPSAFADAHTARPALLDAEIRQRIDTALGDVITGPAQLTIQFERSPAAPSVTAVQNSVANRLQWNWLPNLWVAAQTRPLWLACGLAAVLVATRIVRRRRVARNHATGGATHIESARGRLDRETPTPAAQHSSNGTGKLLPGIDVERWAQLAVREPLRIVAGLLPRLSPNEVAHVIAQLAPAEQREVLQLAPQTALDAREFEALCGRLASQATAASQSRAANAGVEAQSRAPAEGVPSRIASRTVVGFDDLGQADDLSLQLLAARIPIETWRAALVGVSPKLQQRLSKIDNGAGRSSKAANRKPLRLREIESAQRLIVEEWLALSASH